LGQPRSIKVILQISRFDFHTAKDYDAISREYFGRSYFYPEGMSFTKSDALFPPADLAKIIGVEYEGQCKLLCYGPFPRSGPRWFAYRSGRNRIAY
jgi:hypothetical protein